VSAIFSPSSVTYAMRKSNQAGVSGAASPIQWKSCVCDCLGYMPWHVYPSGVQWYTAFSDA